jgi:hypothetical protein
VTEEKMTFKLDLFRKSLSRAASPDRRSDVDSAVAAALAEIARADAEIERLANARSQVLLYETDAALERHDALVSAETRSRDRAVALRDELTARLAEIEAAERTMEMEQERAEAEKLKDVACAALQKYPVLAEQIVDVLTAVARADAAALALAHKYPHLPPIDDAETSVRRDQGGWAPLRLDATLTLPGFLGSEPPVYAPRSKGELLTRTKESHQ